MICAACGGESPESARFCVVCGSSLPRCGACGAAVAPTYQFCPGCGQGLSLPLGHPPPVTCPSLAEARPSPLTNNPAAGNLPLADLVQERRLVAILFADLVGFTALSERLDLEKVYEIVQSCLTQLAAVVLDHGGHVDKFMGDCIMALFGAPVAHDDDVPRAVSAALAMLSRLEEINTALEAEHGVRLAMRVGINAGLVIAGEMGRPGDYTVMGDVVNVASRIQGLAPPGSLLVTEPVRALAGSAFSFAPAGSVSVKNRTMPVEIYEAVEAVTAPVMSAERAATPFVGRDRELARLHEALDQTRAGHGAALWLVGEVGIGKSRLVQEFTATARGHLPVLIGHCRGYAAPLYLPFRHWFEQLESRAGALGLGEAADWGRLLPCPDDFYWLRWALFPERAPPVIPDPETAKRVAHRAFIQFVHGLAQQSPLVLVMEDLHSADSLSLELLDTLAREVPKMPALLVGTARPDAALPRAGAEVLMGPLDAGALRDLLERLLAPHPVSPDVAQWLIEVTRGNPYFLEELAQSVRASGHLVLRGARWELARPPAEMKVPDTVRGVMQARLDALAPIARTVLKEAAVLGSPFDARVLQAMTAAPGQLGEVLEELEGARILAPLAEDEPSPFAVGSRRSFHQAMIQQVAYESMLNSRRRELHERAARAIESLYTERESEVLEDLAEHYARAEVRAPAIHYLGRAAARAQALYANDRAAVLYTRLLELAAGAAADGSRGDRAAVVTAEGGLADLESLSGRFDAAIERLRSLLARGASDLEPEAHAALRRRLGTALARRGESEAAEAELARALALTEGVASPEGHREASRSWYQQATQYYRRGQYARAEEALAASEQRAIAASDAALEADCVLLRGLVRYDTGRRQEAEADLEAALRRKEAIGDLRGMAAALNNLGNLAIDEGRFADARAAYSRALELRRRIGHREGIAAAEINLGNVALSLGSWDAARQHLETAHALCEEIGDAYGAVAAAANRGRLALEMGDLASARQRLQAAWECASSLEFANLAVEAQIGLAEAEIALGDIESGTAAAEAARVAAAAREDPMLGAAATRAAAMAAGAAGRAEAADAGFAASRQAFRELEQPLEEVRTLVRWAAAVEPSARAHALLDEAEPLAEALGAAGELARIRTLRSCPVNPPTARGSRRR